MSKNMMCSEHKTNSKKYRDEYDRIFNNQLNGLRFDKPVPMCDARRCHKCNGLYFDTIGKDVCPYCGY